MDQVDSIGLVEKLRDELTQEVEKTVTNIFKKYIEMHPLFSDLVMEILIAHLEKVKNKLECQHEFSKYDQNDLELLN